MEFIFGILAIVVGLICWGGQTNERILYIFGAIWFLIGGVLTYLSIRELYPILVNQHG